MGNSAIVETNNIGSNVVLETKIMESNAVLQRKNKNGKSKIIIGLFLVVIALGWLGTDYYIQQKNYVTTDNAKVSGDILNVSSKVPGTVVSVNVKDGSLVKKGDVLFTAENQQPTKSTEDGTVIQEIAHAGDPLSAGQTAISIVDMHKLQITAYVMEGDIKRIKLDQPVELSIDALPDQKFNGTVAEVGLATASTFSLFSTDNTSGNYTKVSQRVPLKIDFDYFSQPVFPGMSVTAKIRVNN